MPAWVSRIPGAAGQAWRKHLARAEMVQAAGDWVAGIPDSAARAWRPGRVRDWLELCRLPNLFTAMADPLAGALVLGAGWWNAPAVLAVILASACLYAAGVILNDWHDCQQDAKERPDRPLPSGRIGRWRAFVGALVLIAIALFWIWLVNVVVVGTMLLMAILVYDILAKHAPVAPAIMGLCRSLNLLMGMSLMWPTAGQTHQSLAIYLVVLMGVYILGVSLFARTEVAPARNRELVAGAVVTWAAIIALSLLRMIFPDEPLRGAGYLWAGLLLAAVGYSMAGALLAPSPLSVQRSVKTAVMGVILFDAAIVGFTRGPWLAMVVVVLIVPAIWTGRRLYST